MSDDKKIDNTEVPEQDELKESELEQVNGGAFNAYLNFNRFDNKSTSEKP